MMALLTLAAILSGWCSHYGPGVMAATVEVRQSFRPNDTGYLPPALWVDGYIAVVECDRLGEIVWLRFGDSAEWNQLQVSDCSGHATTTRWMRQNNILGEVDYWMAARYRFAGGPGRCHLMDDETWMRLMGME